MNHISQSRFALSQYVDIASNFFFTVIFASHKATNQNMFIKLAMSSDDNEYKMSVSLSLQMIMFWVNNCYNRTSEI